MRKRIINAIKRFIINTVREDCRNNGELRQVINISVEPSQEAFVNAIRSEKQWPVQPPESWPRG